MLGVLSSEEIPKSSLLQTSVIFLNNLSNQKLNYDVIYETKQLSREFILKLFGQKRKRLIVL
jgi:hypothetical protein